MVGRVNARAASRRVPEAVPGSRERVQRERGGRQPGRMMAAAGVAVAAVCGGFPGVALSGYGPTPPPGRPVPGGFAVVAASVSVDPTTGRVIRVNAGSRGKVILQVGRGSINVPLQFTLTVPNLTLVQRSLGRRYRAIVGVGVQANLRSGTPVKGRFGPSPVVISLLSAKIKHGDKVFAWRAARHKFARVAATVRNGVAIVTVNRYSELIVVQPTPRR